MELLTADDIRRVVPPALAEDVGSGDATTLATVAEGVMAAAVMVAREPLVVAGIELAEATFREVSPATKVERRVTDGARLVRGDILLRL